MSSGQTIEEWLQILHLARETIAAKA